MTIEEMLKSVMSEFTDLNKGSEVVNLIRETINANTPKDNSEEIERLTKERDEARNLYIERFVNGAATETKAPTETPNPIAEQAAAAEEEEDEEIPPTLDEILA